MIARLWPLLVGFTLWALAFVLLYALQYFGCRFGWDPAVHRTVLVVAYLASIAVVGATLALQVIRVRDSRAGAMTIERAGCGASIAALVATVLTFGPTLLASACL